MQLLEPLTNAGVILGCSGWPWWADGSGCHASLRALLSAALLHSPRLTAVWFLHRKNCRRLDADVWFVIVVRLRLILNPDEQFFTHRGYT